MASEQTITPITLSQKNAAKALDISPRHLRRLTIDKTIPCRRVGGLTLYSVKELEAWANGKSDKQ